MASAYPITVWDDPSREKGGCAYLIENGHRERCGAPCAIHSSYCSAHHALTHLARGSAAEAGELKAIRAIAKIAGGRMGRGGVVGPLPGEIEAIERRQLYAIFRMGRGGVRRRAP